MDQKRTSSTDVSLGRERKSIKDTTLAMSINSFLRRQLAIGDGRLTVVVVRSIAKSSVPQDLST
jgi:hypothetical protein